MGMLKRSLKLLEVRAWTGGGGSRSSRILTQMWTHAFSSGPEQAPVKLAGVAIGGGAARV
jgi:hypothetical protein